jgi:hypothetical protein
MRTTMTWQFFGGNRAIAHALWLAGCRVDKNESEYSDSKHEPPSPCAYVVISWMRFAQERPVCGHAKNLIIEEICAKRWGKILDLLYCCPRAAIRPSLGTETVGIAARKGPPCKNWV